MSSIKIRHFFGPAASALALSLFVAGCLSGPAVAEVPDAWLGVVSKTLLNAVDPINGGFGKDGSKSPQAPALDALLAAATRNRDAAAQAALVKTLEAMAYGGIHDPLGGGFYRDAGDPAWTFPRFEKRLVDNAQLLSLYVRSYLPTRTPYLRDVALDTATYLLRDLQAPEGGFYTAQSSAPGADLWSRREVERELGAKDVGRFFGVYEIVPLPDGTHAAGGVLRVRLPIDDTVQRIGATDAISMLNAVAGLRDDLLDRRMDRAQPTTEKTIVTGLNGLAISALAQADIELNRPELIEAAHKAAETIWSTAFDPTRRLLKHAIVDGRAQGDGLVDDHAMLGNGFLDLAEATQDEIWHERAVLLADVMLQRFAQPDGLLSQSDAADDERPSGSSAALDLLARLGTTIGGTRFRTAAARLASAMSSRIAARPEAWPSAVASLARHPMPIEVDVAAPR